MKLIVPVIVQGRPSDVTLDFRGESFSRVRNPNAEDTSKMTPEEKKARRARQRKEKKAALANKVSTKPPPLSGEISADPFAESDSESDDLPLPRTMEEVEPAAAEFVAMFQSEGYAKSEISEYVEEIYTGDKKVTLEFVAAVKRILGQIQEQIFDGKYVPYQDTNEREREDTTNARTRRTERKAKVKQRIAAGKHTKAEDIVEFNELDPSSSSSVVSLSDEDSSDLSEVGDTGFSITTRSSRPRNPYLPREAIIEEVVHSSDSSSSDELSASSEEEGDLVPTYDDDVPVKSTLVPSDLLNSMFEESSDEDDDADNSHAAPSGTPPPSSRLLRSI